MPPSYQMKGGDFIENRNRFRNRFVNRSLAIDDFSVND